MTKTLIFFGFLRPPEGEKPSRHNHYHANQGWGLQDFAKQKYPQTGAEYQLEIGEGL